MHASRVTKVGGVAAAVGGATWLLTLALAQFVSPDLGSILAIALSLIALGALALQVRHAGRMGAAGSAGLAMSLIGGSLLAFGSVGDAVVTLRVLGTTLAPFSVRGLAPGALLFGLGVILSAIGAIRADVLPRLSPIVLLVGAVGVAVVGGVALGEQLVGGRSTDIFPFEIGVPVILWAIFGAAWVWIGFLLWSERLPPDVIR
jgi:hypothetical protein